MDCDLARMTLLVVAIAIKKSNPSQYHFMWCCPDWPRGWEFLVIHRRWNNHRLRVRMDYGDVVICNVRFELADPHAEEKMVEYARQFFWSLGPWRSTSN